MESPYHPSQSTSSHNNAVDVAPLPTLDTGNGASTSSSRLKRPALEDQDDDPRNTPSIVNLHDMSSTTEEPVLEPLGHRSQTVQQAVRSPGARSSGRGPLAKRAAGRRRESVVMHDARGVSTSDGRTGMARSHSEVGQVGTHAAVGPPAGTRSSPPCKRVRTEDGLTRVHGGGLADSRGRRLPPPLTLRTELSPPTASPLLQPSTAVYGSLPGQAVSASVSSLGPSSSSSAFYTMPNSAQQDPHNTYRRRATSLPPTMAQAPSPFPFTPVSSQTPARPSLHPSPLYHPTFTPERRSSASVEEVRHQIDPRLIVEQIRRQDPSTTLSQLALLAIHAAKLIEKRSRALVTPVSMIPPITKATLGELDFAEIATNPRLRHDMVFDAGLSFRPNFDGDRGSRKREAADQYWCALDRELSAGCRCTAYGTGTVLACVCLQPGALFVGVPLAPRLPSRVPFLVLELRNIILSLLPASTCSTTHNQVKEILDPTFLSQQLERGVVGVGELAEFLGGTLKMHCAPMRDASIDLMVKTCREVGGVAKGLRMCFEILELMKLDIANHQLRSLRPCLVHTAVDFEQRFFKEFLTSNKSGSGLDKTRAWFSAAVASVKPSVMATVPSPNTTQLVRHAISFGLLDIIYQPLPVGFATSTSSLPEILQLDGLILPSLSAAQVDLTVTHLLLLLFQQLACPIRVTPHQMIKMRDEVRTLLSTSPKSSASPKGLAKLSHPAWREEVQSVGLQVAMRALRIKNAVDEKTTFVPDLKTTSLVQNYLDSNLRADSKFFVLLQSRLRQTLNLIVDEELKKESATGVKLWIAPQLLSTTMAPTTTTTTNGIPSVIATGSASARIPSKPIVVSSGTRGIKRDVPDSATTSTSDSSPSLSPSDDQPSPRKRRSTDSLSSSSCSSPTTTIHTRSNPISSFTTPPSSSSLVDLSLTRNGLTSLEADVRAMGHRIASMASFHLCVYQAWYCEMLALKEEEK